MKARPVVLAAASRGGPASCRGFRLTAATIASMLVSATTACAPTTATPAADLILLNGRVYTLSWEDPAPDGTPAADAPYGPSGWRPDATAIAVERGSILFVGNDLEAGSYRADHTEVIDLDGAVAVPGLVDAHTHVLNLGATLEQVDLVGVESEEEAVARMAERAATVPAGQWIIGYGWDEGAWADRYPDKQLLSRQVPDHPALLRGLHSFAVWGNQAALDAAGITAATPAPAGGRIVKGGRGQPTGLLIDRATALLTDAVPAPDIEQLERRFELGLQAMVAAGYTMVHEAGLDGQALRALENLAADGELPLRVSVMLSGREPALLRQWREWGPDHDGNDNLMVFSVKAFYDGALGSRGARLLEPYSDRPGHFGVSAEESGFDEQLLGEMMGAGFQVAIHAIGDAGNRETLDFFERALDAHPGAREGRHRIEHAQVVHPDDFPRFQRLGLIASMQPAHAVEDMAWAEDRIGSERLRGAYAWRTLRRHRVPLVFSSDLPGSDHDIFYGLHAATTRRDKQLSPPGGWFPEQRMTAEEALRGYTSWAAYGAFLEASAGAIVPGRRADLTVMDIDPLRMAESDPDDLLAGRILMTIVSGRIVYRAGDAGAADAGIAYRVSGANQAGHARSTSRQMR